MTVLLVPTRRVTLLLGLIAAPIPALAATYDALVGGMHLIQGMSLTEDQVINIGRRYRAAEDASQYVAGPTHPLSVRLDRIVQGAQSFEGVPLEFKIFLDGQVNASAVQSGQIRIHSGLMNMMSDEELLCVIGHEIGHVALGHQLESMRSASLTQGLLSLTAASGATVVDPQIMALGANALFASYSRKMESSADLFGLRFMVDKGVNPWACPAGLDKLSSGARPPGLALFATHPYPEKRSAELRRRISIMGRFANEPQQFPAPGSGPHRHPR